MIDPIGYGQGSSSAWANAVVAAINGQLGGAFTDATARDAEIDTPTAGMMAYLTTPKHLTVHDGTDWKLLAGSGTWTPTLTNIAVGTGGSAALNGTWRFGGGLLHFTIDAVLGTSGASVTGEPTFSLPAGFTATALVGTNLTDGLGVYMQAGATAAVGDFRTVSTTAIAIRAANAAGTYLVFTSITSTVPGTWAAGSFIRAKGVVGGVMTS